LAEDSMFLFKDSDSAFGKVAGGPGDDGLLIDKWKEPK